MHNELLDTLHYFANQQRNNGAVGLVPSIIPLLGSVADEIRVSDVILTWKPHIIYHAAAVKHVPIVEHNIAECVKNNVLGTLVMAKVAIERQVERLILVSTDKAVNPTNAMGASKRCCELILQALAAEQNPSFEPMWDGKPSAQVARTTQLAMVRFGNVLGSSGSVVPYFRQQIAQGGPITLTHLDITRYFMTTREAVELVLQASALGSADAGGIFVLDMGEPVRIADLAEQMIRLAGKRPYEEVDIEFIGLRTGEKLYEELFHDAENLAPTDNAAIQLATPRVADRDVLERAIDELSSSAQNGDDAACRSQLAHLVPEFHSENSLSDTVASK